MKEISTPLEGLLDYLRECVQLDHIADDELIDANALMQDMLHSLVLVHNDEDEYVALAQELAETTQNRRTAKDKLITTAPVASWLEQNQAVVKGLERLLGEIRKAEKSTENRVYIPRVRR